MLNRIKIEYLECKFSDTTSKAGSKDQQIKKFQELWVSDPKR